MIFLCDVHIPYKLVNFLKSKNCSAFHINHIFSDLIKLNVGKSSTDQIIELFKSNWNLLDQVSKKSFFYIESDTEKFLFNRHKEITHEQFR